MELLPSPVVYLDIIMLQPPLVVLVLSGKLLMKVLLLLELEPLVMMLVMDIGKQSLIMQVAVMLLLDVLKLNAMPEREPQLLLQVLLVTAL